MARRRAREALAVTPAVGSEGRRPLLAIAHGESSVSAMKVAEAAEPV